MYLFQGDAELIVEENLLSPLLEFGQSAAPRLIHFVAEKHVDYITKSFGSGAD